MNRDQELVRLLREYLEELGIWPSPPVMDCWAFLVTEVSEIGDALLRLGYGERSDYVRSNPKESDLQAELCDTYFMLLSLANLLDCDLSKGLEMRVNDLYKFE